MSEQAWTQQCDWKVWHDGRKIVSDDEFANDIVFAALDDDRYPFIVWENDQDPERIAAMHNATRGLSPECVKACVDAAKANAAYRKLLVQPDSAWHECAKLQRVASNAAFAASELLPKEVTP